MDQFDEQLLRLKLCLGITKDAEVAAALGMSRAALSNRKQAGSFPEEQAIALKEQHPELDLMYVFTGERWRAGELVLEEYLLETAARSGSADMTKSAYRSARNHVQALKDAASDPQVRELLGILICCDRAAIARVVAFALGVMGKNPMPFAEREPATSKLLSARALGEPDDASVAKKSGKRATPTSKP